MAEPSVSRRTKLLRSLRMVPDGDEIRFPRGRVVFDPAVRDWLENSGYLHPDRDNPHPAREVFFRSRRRENARRDDGPGGIRLYDKRLVGRRDAAAGLREWQVLQHARRAGLKVPRPLVAGAVVRNGHREAFLVTEAMEGVPLDALVGEVPRSRARDLATAVGRAVAELHRHTTFPSLFSKHVLVAEQASGFSIGFIDLADASPRPPTPKERARDLGSLAATLPVWPVTRALRLAGLKAYLQASRADWSPKQAWVDIQKATRRRMRRRRFRVHLAPRGAPAQHLMRPDPHTVALVEEAHQLDDLGPLDNLSESPRGTFRHGPLTVRSGTPEDIQSLWTVLLLLRRFKVSAPTPVAYRAVGDRVVIITREVTGLTAPLPHPFPSDPLVALLDRLFLAGLFPRRGFLAGLATAPDGSLHLARPEVHRPPIVNRRPLRRSLARLRRELRALGVSRSEVASIVSRAAARGVLHVG